MIAVAEGTMDEESRAPAADERIRAMVLAGDVGAAATALLRSLGPEVFGFLRASLGNESDADEVFASTSERVWRSLASFRWQCTLRTWTYVVARNEIARFADGTRRHHAGRVTPSQLDEVVAMVRTETRSALRTEKRNKLKELRDELPVDDRALLVLRIDRELEWEEVARTFLPESCTEEEIKRESARLRKRFQLVKRRLADRARQEGLLS
jgi:RNA polymerase sigma-70 factor (ECF subfamily)